MLRPALEAAGYRIEHSEAGLYLWTTRDGNDRVGDADQVSGTGPGPRWPLVSELADLGILVAPGTFYGAGGGRYVRISLTASDEGIAVAAGRLANSGQHG